MSDDVIAKIMINRQNAGGDVLMVEPIVRLLYEQRDGRCQIDVCTAPHNKSCIDHSPYVSNVVETFNIFNYDIFINLDTAYEKYPWMHPTQAYAKIALGIDSSGMDLRPKIVTDDNDKNIARQLKQHASKYIVMHMRSSFNVLDSRNIDKNIWDQYIKLVLAHTDLHIVIVGAYCDHFPAYHDRLIDLREKLTIKQLKEVIAHSNAFVGADSLPSHVANSTDVPSFVLYTSASADVRKYESKSNSIPIAADIDCYGCRKHLPPPVFSSNCHRKDVECTRRFDPENMFKRLLSVVNEPYRTIDLEKYHATV